MNKSHISREELLERFGDWRTPVSCVLVSGNVIFDAKHPRGERLIIHMKKIDYDRLVYESDGITFADTTPAGLIDYCWYIEYDYVEIYENPVVKKRAETFERFSESKDGKIQYK